MLTGGYLHQFRSVHFVFRFGIDRNVIGASIEMCGTFGEIFTMDYSSPVPKYQLYGGFFLRSNPLGFGVGTGQLCIFPQMDPSNLAYDRFIDYQCVYVCAYVCFLEALFGVSKRIKRNSGSFLRLSSCLLSDRVRD